MANDLVLMDILLKGKMEGIEAADHIRNNFDVPVIFLTAYGNESKISASESGMRRK